MISKFKYSYVFVFVTLEWLDQCDEFLSLIQEPREGESEAEREFWEKMINKVKKHNAKISSGEPIAGEIQKRRKVPPLKLLSAIAICKKYKESEEIQSLGPDAIIGWTANCRYAPQEYPRREGDVMIDLHPAHGRPNWRCGFCRFVKKSQACISDCRRKLLLFTFFAAFVLILRPNPAK